MRTNIYVDGFNLYYGALKHTPYKWLDLSRLFNDMLPRHYQIRKIKYFTAKIRRHANDPFKPQRQNIYIRALQAYCSEIEIIKGSFLSHKINMPSADQPDRMVRVIKTEEKGSDVNLAVHLLNDAWLNEYDCAVVVSNDSDLATAMRLVSHEQEKQLWLLTPGTSTPSQKLGKHVGRNMKRNIRNTALERSQLPDRIPGTNIRKPWEWSRPKG